jgi:hypothetical protein
MSSRRHSIRAKKGKIVAIPSQPLNERSQPLFLGLLGAMSKEEDGAGEEDHARASGAMWGAVA